MRVPVKVSAGAGGAAMVEGCCRFVSLVCPSPFLSR